MKYTNFAGPIITSVSGMYVISMMIVKTNLKPWSASMPKSVLKNGIPEPS